MLVVTKTRVFRTAFEISVVVITNAVFILYWLSRYFTCTCFNQNYENSMLERSFGARLVKLGDFLERIRHLRKFSAHELALATGRIIRVETANVGPSSLLLVLVLPSSVEY